MFDSEAAWNGNKLKDLSQIDIFFIYLDTGKHTLYFTADQSPYLEIIKIHQAGNEQNIIFEPSKNYQIEKGNGRPWINFILVKLSLRKLTVEARANNILRDDDDLQLRINGKREENDLPKSHKYWYWCGRVLKGQSRVFERDSDLPPGLHYIELLADNMPFADKVILKLEKKEKESADIVGRIAIYDDVIVGVKEVHLRDQPSDQSETLEKIPNGEKIIILTKAVRGNRPDGLLSDLWHGVLYKGKKGFVHSSLLEIKEQERAVIIETIKAKANDLNLDENLAINLSHCESKWLPFARSETDNKGIYQLGKDTIKDINEKYGGNISDVYNAYQNIDGGLRYFKFLLKRYANLNDFLTRAIVAWNVGYNKVPVDGSFRLENYKDPETKRLLHCTFKERRGENVLRYLKLLILPFIVGAGFWMLFISNDYKNLDAREKYLALVAQQEVNYLTEGENFAEIDVLKAREKEVKLGYLQTDIDEDQIFEKIIFTFYSPEAFSYYTNIYAPDGEKIIVGGSLWKTFIDDLTGDGVKELIVETISGHLSMTYIFFYKNGHLEKIPIYDENGIELQNTIPDTMLATSLEIRFKDLDGDNIKEIILPIRNYDDEFVEPTYYYRWNNKGFILYDKKDIILSQSGG